ncbi:MAG: alpha/beta fold hydrolase [Proteobacteria bacterium]|jgi:polyhydroxyalkanoate synthase subunit PhaC|nr:alpha/beta fold hydrolase [Pseudomonadota bacterium]
MINQAAQTARFLANAPERQIRIGQTPHTVIHRQGTGALRYFAPKQAKYTPLFISMPLINTWTIWDLLPQRSVVEALCHNGVPVYLLDWGRPGPEDVERGLVEHIDDWLGRAFSRAQRHCGTEMDVAGYCVGGTFLAIWLARNPDAARRAAFVCSPFDFHASGRLATWANPETFPVDSIVDGLGNFPASLMRTSFAWLRPMGQLSKYKTLMDRIDRPGFTELWAAMEKWSADNVDFPGEAYREYVKRCYFDNALIKGGWILGNREVDLAAATIPALAIAADSDHICPPEAAFGLDAVWGGEVTKQTLRGGHVGISVTPALPDALMEWIRS